MGIKRLWVIEEVDIGDNIGHRQTAMEFEDITGELIRPDSRLGAAAIAEWDLVMTQLSTLGGRDMRHIVNGVALKDHCLDIQNNRNHRRRGSTDRP